MSRIVDQLFITGLDFTSSPELFAHLQNRGEELLFSVTARLMKSLRFPFVLVITCDRAEIVGTGKASCETLERSLSLSPLDVASFRYSIEGLEECSRHIFLLSSGTISPLFGEDTIQGQLDECASAARLSGSSCPQLNKLFNMAVSFAKSLHSRHQTRVFDKSIAIAVADRLKEYGRILITGSGEGARLVAKTLIEDGHEVHMALRDEAKTFLVPVGAIPVSYGRKMEEASWADAIVSASSGLYHTFTEDECMKIAPKPMYDLAMPNDLPRCTNVVPLCELDVEESEKEEVRKLVESEVEKVTRDYLSWLGREDSCTSVETMGQEVAEEAMRRLNSVFASLPLDKEAERDLRTSVLDSVRKAYVTRFYSWRKKDGN